MTTIPVLVLAMVALASGAGAADLAERESLRYNDAVTKLEQTRNETVANARAKVVIAFTMLAKQRGKADDAAGAAEAWRAVLVVDRDHVDARAHFTQLGTLDAVLAELDAKPTDLLGPADADDVEPARPAGKSKP
jgi:hypothetical protein